MAFGSASFLWYLLKGKDVKKLYSELDIRTGFFLMAIFILVESLVSTELILDFASMIQNFTGNGLALNFFTLVFVSVIFSAFIDNIPFLAAMLPVTQIIINSTGANPYLLYFGLLIGASVGGNITPVGASANIVAMGMLKKKGFKLRFMDFVKIGLPFTIAAVLTSSLFVWVFFR